MTALSVPVLVAGACSGEAGDDPAPQGDGGSEGGSSSGTAGSAAASGSGASGGSGAGGTGAAGAGAVGGSAGTAGCAAVPAGVPPCWERLEYPPGVGNCDVYYPGSQAEMPSPIVWDEAILPTDPPIPARVMNTDSPDGSFDHGVYLWGWFDAEANRVLLAFMRGVRGIARRYRILADADGLILNAALSVHPSNKTCEVAPTEFSSRHFVLNVLPAKEGTYEGAVISELGSRSKPLALYLEGARPSTFTVSDDHIVRWANGVFVRSWDSDEEASILPIADSPSLLTNVFARDGSVFTTVTGQNPGTQIWQPATGSRPFMRFGAGNARGASNMVTDGKDWVWTEGTRTSTGWTDFELYTAPYSLDPEQVRATARRLHSEPTGWSSFVFRPTVGCGYRARVHPTDHYELHVTRLSDGHRWIVHSQKLSQDQHFAITAPLAVSCEEVFVQTSQMMLSRIRLADLGPGQPAD
ncbi:MAG: hypothetical protein KF915_20800 [Polyangiaceae bacterium]|nr:hypothetical protein [Polyangiaceae bacterium]